MRLPSSEQMMSLPQELASNDMQGTIKKCVMLLAQRYSLHPTKIFSGIYFDVRDNQKIQISGEKVGKFHACVLYNDFIGLA